MRASPSLKSPLRMRSRNDSVSVSGRLWRLILRLDDTRCSLDRQGLMQRFCRLYPICGVDVTLTVLMGVGTSEGASLSVRISNVLAAELHRRDRTSCSYPSRCFPLCVGVPGLPIEIVC